MINCHDNSRHIEYRRVINKIMDDKYYWKSIRNDFLNYVIKCPYCIYIKSGIVMNPEPKIIITKGPKERYVIDGWKLHNELVSITGFT